MDLGHSSNGRQLQKLLERWTTCPPQLRLDLTAGVSTLDALASPTDKFEVTVLPATFFRFACDGGVRALERWGWVDENFESVITNAWHAVQQSICSRDNPELHPTIRDLAIVTLQEMRRLHEGFGAFATDMRSQGRDDEALVTDIQKMACEGTIVALRRVVGELGEADLESLSQDLGGKLQNNCAQVAQLRAKARKEGERSTDSVCV